MDIGEIERIIRVAPEPYPMGRPEDAPHEPAPLTAPKPDVEEVPA